MSASRATTARIGGVVLLCLEYGLILLSMCVCVCVCVYMYSRFCNTGMDVISHTPPLICSMMC